MALGVLIIVENLPVPFDRRVWQIATTLQKAGHEVSVICPKSGEHVLSRECLEGVEIYRHSLPIEGDSMIGYIGEYLWALLAQLALTIRVMASRKVDVLHGCNPPDNIFLIAWFLKLFGKKYVFDHHDICPELFEAKFGHKGFAYRVARRLERLTFWTADMSIATNESYRKIAIERGGMSPDKVFVVRSGPDLSRVRKVEESPKLRMGRKYLVAYVGVMGKQEGLDLLLRSIQIITQEFERTDIHFGLVGGGTELPTLIEYANELEISDFVTFTGRVSDSDLLAMLSTAAICVNPDRVNEMNDKSTMNKILEYMALGKPIVQFDMTEGRISAGDSSLYAKANDERDFAYKILELLENDRQRSRMGEIGIDRVQKELSWEHQGKRLLEAYATLETNVAPAE